MSEPLVHGTQIEPATVPAAALDTGDTYNFTTLQKGGVSVATTADVNAMAAKLFPKADVYAAEEPTTGSNVASLSGLANVIDGIAIDSAGLRVALMAQTDASENGIYVSAAGAWSRAEDFNQDVDVEQGAWFVVKNGDNNAGKAYLLQTDNPEIDADNLVFVQFPNAGSALDVGTGGDLSTIQAGDGANAGNTGRYADAGHEHGVETAAPSGSFAESGSASEGVSTSLMRADAGFILPDLGREGASTLAANIKRRDAELQVTPPTNGVVYENGGVLGLAVQAEGSPAMSVRVAAGTAYNRYATRLNIPAGNQQVTVSAADGTHPRIDAIVLGANGSLACRAGTPGASPSVPSLTDGDVLLAYIDVPANDTTIASGQIYDQRRCSNPSDREMSFQGDGTETDFEITGFRPLGVVHGFRGGLAQNKVTTPANASQFSQANDPLTNGTVLSFSDTAPLNGQNVTFRFRA